MYQTGEDIVSSPAVADLDKDGKLEVLVGSNDDYLYCLTIQGLQNSGTQRWWHLVHK